MTHENCKIYKNPTVNTFVFQIRFSNLFMIENKIGEYQTRIMDKFPDSLFTIRRELLFTDVRPEFKLVDIKPHETIGSRKRWKFKSNDNYELNVLTNSLDITSKKHKSYYGDGDTEGFKDIIKFAVDNFLDLMPIKTIKRIRIRYIDCSLIPSLDSETFKKWYTTVFPLERSNLDQAGSLFFEARNIQRGNYEFNYRETFAPERSEDSEEFDMQYILDLDGYAVNIPSEKYIDVLDELRDLIHNEWENNTIRQPVKDWMDKDKEE